MNNPDEPVLDGEVLPTEDEEKELTPVNAPAVPKEEQKKEPLSPLAEHLVAALSKHEDTHDERKITVNPLVSKVAFWYEKLRKAMEYREEEVLLRATIERILRRRLLLGGNAKTTAEPLVRELMWARYLPENDVRESLIQDVEDSIELFLKLRFAILQKHKLPENTVNTWIYQLMSSDIEHIVSPNREKELIGNFMYQVLKKHIIIDGESEENQNAQVYIAVRKAFARDDIAFLRYHLFRLYFGPLTHDSLGEISERFEDGYNEIVKGLNYSKKEKIYSYVKKRTAPFLILEDVVAAHAANLKQVVLNKDALDEAIFSACERRYQSISTKVRTAIVRSVLFIILTKVIFAFVVEGTYERIVYGEILWDSIIINITIPPVLMVIASFFIKTPGKENSERIRDFIHGLLFSDHPKVGNSLHLKKDSGKKKPITVIFTILWVFAFILTFGGLMALLNSINFNPVSQFIFIFFLTIVSFLTYRISLTASIYQLGNKQGWFTPIADFLFMPIVQVGRNLTHSISSVNFFLILFDFLIETPFKLLFEFFEQWFSFLSSKREEME